MGLAGGTPGPLGVELGVVPPPPFICLLFRLVLLGGHASDSGQQGLCTSPFCCFPPKTFSSKLVQGWGPFRPLLLRPPLSLHATAVVLSTVPPLPLQMFLHLPKRVQAVLDLLIWTWARLGGPSPRGELVPRWLSLGFRCTLAQVRQDAQSFLLPLLRETETREMRMSPRGALHVTTGHVRLLDRQNQHESAQPCVKDRWGSCPGQ